MSAEALSADQGPLDVLGREEKIIGGFDARKANDRTPRARVAMWLAMRSMDPSLSFKDAGDRMGVSGKHLRNLVYEARKAGWLTFTDPMDQIEFAIIPKVIDNLNHFLDARDKTVTIETAKGTIFPQFKESKGISEAPHTVLALKIEAPVTGTDTPVLTGHIVGRPRQLEE